MLGVPSNKEERLSGATIRHSPCCKHIKQRNVRGKIQTTIRGKEL
jgi:hypothetical protein